MKSDRQDGHSIQSVARGSAGARLGARSGDILLAINGENIIDEIDYQFLSATEDIALTVERGGEVLSLQGRKRDYAPLGLTFERPLNGNTRTCANRCAFCFVDQMPEGMRPSLYVKDDDWRLSLRSGHYITLTNVGEREFQRILARRASPLYISVHATDPDARVRLLGNPRAGEILPRLQRLKEAGLKFHAQIVLCPGYNDGEVFTRTINDLAALHPAALSVAVVPVGLTKFREGLAHIEPFTRESAGDTIDSVERTQREYLAKFGTRFLFAADELYCLAGRELPPFDAYEHFPQIENGVGMLRQMEDEYVFAMSLLRGVRRRDVTLVCGVSPAAFLTDMLARHPVPGVRTRILPVKNRFSGETVTVSGLITGRDLTDALRGLTTDEVLVPSRMLRSRQEEVFLDDMTLDEVRAETGLRITPAGYDGEDLLSAIAGGTDRT